MNPVPLANPVPLSPPTLHLVEEINHRVVNEYAEAIASLALAARSAGPSAQEVLHGAAERLRVHADLHKALYRPSAACSVHLGDYVGSICRSLTRACLEDRGIRIQLTADDVWVPGDVAWRVGLIVAELIRNASRHALSGRAGAIALRITGDESGLSCMVADNGVGDPRARAGRGRRVLEAIAEELGGRIGWTFSANGNLVHLDLPSSELSQ